MTVRRQRCSALLEYDFDHFRKRVENRVLWTVAEAIHRDLVNYRARVRRATNAYEISRPTPTLTPAELTREEELVSRIWQHLYQLRAERIALALADDDGQAGLHRLAVEQVTESLRQLTDQYIDTYGKQFIPNGQLEYAIEGLERLVIWKLG